MKTYLKLVHMEIYRFRFILLGLMALTAVIQLLGMQMFLSDMLDHISRQMDNKGISLREYAAENGKLNLGSLWSHQEGVMTFPVVICMVVIGLYIFVIWYRDWFGKSGFVYRLLMLPHPRFTLYLSKFTALMIIIFSMIAFQVIVVILEMVIFHYRVPGELREYYTLIQTIGSWDLSIFIPVRFQEFLLVYGIGAAFVLMLFTTVLLERSYRLKGLILGLIYTIGMLVVVAWMFEEASSKGGFLYPSELLLATISLMLVSAALSLWLGRWLLRKKVTV